MLTPEQRQKWLEEVLPGREKLLQAIVERAGVWKIGDKKTATIAKYECSIFVEDVKDLLALLEKIMEKASEKLDAYEQYAAKMQRVVVH